jgi:alpha-amylase
MLPMKSLRAFFLLTIAGCVCLKPAYADATRILENDPSITYTGMWYTNQESPNIGGQSYLTNAKGAEAMLSFTGTGITWIGVLDPYSGMANVYLDGTLYVVDTYGSSTQYQQPLFAVHGLAPGPHTLSINVLHQRDDQTSGSWIWINAFDIDNGSGLPGGVSAASGRIEQNDPSVSYTGKWFLITNPALSGGTAVQGVDQGSRATISFNGSGVKWIGYRDQWSGIANVYLDGTLAGQIDLYSAAEQPQAVAYDSGDLTSGAHSLTIEVTGTRDAMSAGSWVWVDSFDVR